MKKAVKKRAARLAHGDVGSKATGRGKRGIPLVGRMQSPGAPGSGIAGAGANEVRKDLARKR